MPPFRTELIRSTPEKIAALNAAEGRTGYAAFLATPGDAVRRAYRGMAAYREAQDAQIGAIVDHPDETWPYMLLRNRTFPPNHWLTLRSRLRRHASERLLKRGLQDGSIWNPILDSLAVSGYWPIRSWQEEREAIGPAEQANKLQYWIGEQTNPRATEELLRFDAQEIVDAVARHASAWNTDLLFKLLERRADPALIASNPALPRNLAAELERWATRHLSRTAEEFAPVPAARTLAALNKAGHPLGEDSLSAMLLTAAACQRAHEREAAHTLAVCFAEAAPRLTPSEIDELARMFASSHQLCERVLNHPAADTRTWKAALATFSADIARKMVLTRAPRARRDPDVRRDLIATRHRATLMDLAGDASAAEFREIFSHFVNTDPGTALDLIEDPKNTGRLELSAEDMLPLMQSADVEVRLRAITTVPNVIGSKARGMAR